MKVFVFIFALATLVSGPKNYRLHGHYEVISKPFKSGLDFWHFGFGDTIYTTKTKAGTEYGKIEKVIVGDDTYFYLRDNLKPEMKTKFDSILFQHRIIEILNPSEDTIKFRITYATQLNITSGSGIMIKH